MSKKPRHSIKRKRQGRELNSGKPRKFMVFSLKDFDGNQGQTFEEWEHKQILSNLMTFLRDLSSLTIAEAMSQKKLKIYDGFPPKSKFCHPKHVPPAVNSG